MGQGTLDFPGVNKPAEGVWLVGCSWRAGCRVMAGFICLYPPVLLSWVSVYFTRSWNQTLRAVNRQRLSSEKLHLDAVNV